MRLGLCLKPKIGFEHVFIFNNIHPMLSANNTYNFPYGLLGNYTDMCTMLAKNQRYSCVYIEHTTHHTHFYALFKRIVYPLKICTSCNIL